MKITRLLVATTLLGAAAPLAAQADPISGTWTGDIGLDLVNRFPLKFELKFEAGALSGAVTSAAPATFKTGSFDGTTGAIRIELTPTNGGAPFVLEGTAINGMAMGRVSDGNKTGSFRLSKVGTETVAASPGDAAAALRKQFGLVSDWISKSAELVPADKYNYRPSKDVRSFGQIIGHVADAFNYYCAAGSGKQVQWSDPVEKGATDKATLAPKLKQALDGCTAVYASGGDVDPLTENIAHSNLHYGNLITYMRLMGIVPPSSR